MKWIVEAQVLNGCKVAYAYYGAVSFGAALTLAQELGKLSYVSVVIMKNPE